ncbi:MAG: hypothetical protein NZ889_00040 [Candidatus Pacearchaeota archaeon]|nr:hypothetical protein [Candidatus Pacearchaeota archaeon]
MKEIPLAEITLRKYEKPTNLNYRQLAKKICLSLGLLQSGDSRDIVVDILLVLKKAQKEKRELTVEEIKKELLASREKNGLEIKGIADSNIRRQLKKLRDILLVEKRANKYRLNEFLKLHEIFEKKIEKFYFPNLIERIKEYLKEFDEI